MSIGANTTDEHALASALKILQLPYHESVAQTYSLELQNAAEKLEACQCCTVNAEESQSCSEVIAYWDDAAQRYRFSYGLCRRARMFLQTKKIEKLFGRTCLGERFKKRRFDTFIVNQDNKAAYEAALQFCQGYTAHSNGLRIWGGYGCGKTHLAGAIIMELLKQDIAGVFVVVPDLLQAIRRSYDETNKNDNDLQSLFDTVKNAPLLVLDDLAAEKTNEWVREKLYILINARYEQELPTIITTNCNTAQLKEQVGERIISRIIEMTDVVKIEDKDHRLGGMAI